MSISAFFVGGGGIPVVWRHVFRVGFGALLPILQIFSGCEGFAGSQALQVHGGSYL